MSIDRRLGRLAETLLPNASEACEECGAGYPVESVEYELESDDEAVPEFCETCGRQTTYVVGWGDEDGGAA